MNIKAPSSNSYRYIFSQMYGPHTTTEEAISSRYMLWCLGVPIPNDGLSPIRIVVNKFSVVKKCEKSSFVYLKEARSAILPLCKWRDHGRSNITFLVTQEIQPEWYYDQTTCSKKSIWLMLTIIVVLFPIVTSYFFICICFWIYTIFSVPSFSYVQYSEYMMSCFPVYIYIWEESFPPVPAGILSPVSTKEEVRYTSRSP